MPAPSCASCRAEGPLEVRGHYALCPRCASLVDRGEHVAISVGVEVAELGKQLLIDDARRRGRALFDRVDSHPIGRIALDFLEGRAARRRREGGG